MDSILRFIGLVVRRTLPEGWKTTAGTLGSAVDAPSDKSRKADYWSRHLTKPTDEERRKAEREAQEKARRGTLAQTRHAEGCRCPTHAPEDWT